MTDKIKTALENRPLTIGVAVAIFSVLTSVVSGAVYYQGTITQISQSKQKQEQSIIVALASLEVTQNIHTEEIDSFRTEQRSTDQRLERIEEVLFALAHQQGLSVPKLGRKK